MQKDGLLELESRREIYNYILKHPGLHIRELERKLKIPATTLLYHLKFLEKFGFLVTKTEGRINRYYVKEKIDRHDKQFLNQLRRKTPRKILLFLTYYPHSTRLQISESLKKHPTTISYHLEKLIKAEFVEGIKRDGEIRYRVGNLEKLYGLLVPYRQSYFDDQILPVLKVMEDFTKVRTEQTLRILFEIFPPPFYM